MFESIKKNWFVVLITIALVVVIGSYGITQIQSVHKGKTVDGNAVVYEIAGKDVFVSDYYDMLDASRGDSDLFKLFKRQLLTNLETTEENKKEALETAEAYKKQISASNGEAGLKSLDAWLVAQGYSGLDELPTYYEDATKQINIIRDYFVANYDSLFKETHEENKDRLVSHILIKMTDPNNPTDDEKAKMDEVQKMLDSGTDFGEVALQKSEDTTSAVERGSIGVINKSSSLDSSFLAATLELNAGETSTWVKSQFGQHLIKVMATDFPTLLENDDYYSSLVSANNTVAATAVWEKAKTLNVVFDDPTVETRLKKYLGIESEEH